MNLKVETNKFLKPMGITAKRGTEFMALWWRKVIKFPRYEEDFYNEGFMNEFHKVYPDIKCHEFIISILHEVGHCKNPPLDWTEEEVKRNNPYAKNYFQNYDEKIATLWAANYIRTHEKEVREFEKKLAIMLEKG